MPRNKFDATTFLNVDLDIYSKSNLQPLLAGLGRRILVLHKGRDGKIYRAHLELARTPKTADVAIRGFATLIRALPKHERRLWNSATVRCFNIGIQAATQPYSYEIPLARKTIEVVSWLQAQIVVTVYAAEAASAAKRPVRKSSGRAPNN